MESGEPVGLATTFVGRDDKIVGYAGCMYVLVADRAGILNRVVFGIGFENNDIVIVSR